MNDTARFQQMSAATKLKLSHELYLTAKQLKRAGIKMLHPEWTDEQVNEALREFFLYGRP